ncbi:C4-dicarboxylate TRAP transporter substrate-binding protein [Candidatus Rariloculus sp.]|uniref:C4-dicarboxylate TRAP transporter substrate-binding protein n=1 Tax=Candidatus Rariloculus sp. TaxID=3101265 RepID=UPI003D0D451C
MRKVRQAAFGAIALAALSAGVPAEAETIRLTVAASHTTALPWVGVMGSLVVPESNRRLAAMGSPHSIRWTEAYGGSLYKYENTLEAVQIGLTDIGWVGTLWELSKMPLQNVTYYTPFATDDYQMLYEIVNELHEVLPSLRDAWTDQNARFLGGSVLDTYHLMTNFPVESVDDLSGRKILAPGPSATWLGGTGAVAVDGGLTTYYTQIQTGVADGVLTILTGAPPYRIHEVAPYITLVGLGAQLTGGMAINLDTWNSLPEDVQQVLETLGAEYSKGVADELGVRYDRGLESMQADGATVTTLPLEERRRWLDGMPNIAALWAESAEARGIPAREILETYMDAIRQRGGSPLRDWDRDAP